MKVIQFFLMGTFLVSIPWMISMIYPQITIWLLAGMIVALIWIGIYLMDKYPDRIQPKEKA